MVPLANVQRTLPGMSGSSLNVTLYVAPESFAGSITVAFTVPSVLPVDKANGTSAPAATGKRTPGAGP